LDESLLHPARLSDPGCRKGELVHDGAWQMLAAGVAGGGRGVHRAVRRSRRRGRASPGGPQRLPPAAGCGHRGRCGDGDRAAGERQAGEPGNQGAGAVSSRILPAWSRKSPKVAEVLPLLYLHGLSSLDFAPALEQFLGSGAGLSAATVTRLTAQWQDKAKTSGNRDLSHVGSSRQLRAAPCCPGPSRRHVLQRHASRTADRRGRRNHGRAKISIHRS
jgi:hypothetical protein